MYKKPKRPFRYDFFTIWGNGLTHKDEILDILRDEDSLEIIRIESRTVKNMKKFVFDLYGCDIVPIEHLCAKLKYLFRVKPEIMVVFVKNYNPREMPAGQGAFRKVQCQYIYQIKIKIRNQYNPRHPDKDFQILPLDKGVTHEHVIHASDYEEQVDYFLKMLGYPEGISFLDGDSEGLPFIKPYHIKRPKSYIFKRLPLRALRASILKENPRNGNKPVHELLPVNKTPHYLGLCGSKDYERYLEQYRYVYLTADHYPEKLYRLRKLSMEGLKSLPPVLVQAEDDYYRILDGVHRVAAYQYHEQAHTKCVEFVY